MRALVLGDLLTFRQDVPIPPHMPGEALIRVTHAGVCNTDLELVKGYMGFRGVLGHEFVGRIEALPADAPPSTSLRVGDRVVGEINCVHPASPSRDYFSRAQDAQRTTLGIAGRDGVFADYTLLPTANLHRVPDTVSDDEAVFVEPLAAACQILEQVHIKTTNRVAVIGDGKLGLLCAQVLATTNCDLVVLGKHQSKLALLHPYHIRTMLTSDWDGRREFDIVVECSGAPAGFEQARSMLRPRGVLVLKSTFAGLTAANLTAFVVDEISIVGSRCGPFASALRLLANKQVDVLSLIHNRYPLEDGLQAMQRAGSAGVLKVLIDVER